MALLNLGPVIFGGNAKIIAYLRGHGLLSSQVLKAVQGT